MNPPVPFHPGRPQRPRPGSRLLLISYHFPPSSAVGGLRWQKFAPFFAEQGWDLDVVTLAPESLPNPDTARLAELPDSTRVYGVPRPVLPIQRLEHVLWRLLRSLRPAPARPAAGPAPAQPVVSRPGSANRREILAQRRSLRPGAIKRDYHAWLDYAVTRRWAAGALRTGLALSREIDYAAVVSCGPPHMAHEAARRLARRSGIPFVMDMRDPWSLVQRLPGDIASPLWFALADRYEGRCVAESALVVANTEPARAALAARHPAAAARIAAIPNGFDDERMPQAGGTGRFLIAYAGSVYLDRDPRPLFQAVARVVRSRGLTPEDLGIGMIGNVENYGGVPVSVLAREEGIAEFVETGPARPRREAMEFLAGAQLLVSLPQDSDLAIPSKVFEYMSFPAWILALADPGSATADLLSGTGAFATAPGDVEGIAAVVNRCYEQYVRGVRPEPLSANRELSRETQAGRLLESIRRLLPVSPGAMAPSPATR